MASDIRVYRTAKWALSEANDMCLTATVQHPKTHGHAIQFTIGGEYCILTQNQLEDMLEVIKNRIACEEGFTATGMGEGFAIVESEEIGEARD